MIAGRQAANLAVFQPMAAPDVQYVPLPDRSSPILSLTDSGVNGSFLVATGARDSDGCYQAAGINLPAKSISLLSDCLISANASVFPVVAPSNGDSIGAAEAPLTVTLPSPASVLNATPTGFAATLPGKPVQIASIDPVMGDVQATDAAPAALGAAAAPAVDINGLKHVYASAGVGQNRTAVIAGDDPLRPTKAVFAVLSPSGDVVESKDFPSGWLPLLDAVAPVRAGQTAPVAPPREPATFDAATRLFFALARADDGSKDAFLAFALGNADPKVVAFPDGWFATSCTDDIRLFTLDLVHQLALPGSKAAEKAFKTACPASGFLMVDLAKDTVAAIPLGNQGKMRVPTAKTDTSLAEMNNYVFGVNLDATRVGTSDTVYVLDGVNGSAFAMPVPSTVSGFTDATLQQIPEANSLLVQTISRLAGDEGFVLFNLDRQTVASLPLPDGFASVANLDDGATVCCLATHKLAARALKQGGSNGVIYDLVTGDVVVVANPDGVTSVGPPLSTSAA